MEENLEPLARLSPRLLRPLPVSGTMAQRVKSFWERGNSKVLCNSGMYAAIYYAKSLHYEYSKVMASSNILTLFCAIIIL